MLYLYGNEHPWLGDDGLEEEDVAVVTGIGGTLPPSSGKKYCRYSSSKQGKKQSCGCAQFCMFCIK